LIERLTQHIPNEVERTQFVGVLNRSGIKHTGSLSGSSSKLPATAREIHTDEKLALDSQQLKAIATLLAFYVGPIASRLVNKAWADNSDRKACIAALAQHIPNSDERADFFEKARKL
jgi:hypothetical protein